MLKRLGRHCRRNGASFLVVAGLAAALTGCPARRSSTPAGSQALSFLDEPSILAADASTAPVQSALQALALDRTRTVSMRYTALRKLEEAAPRAAVSLAGELAAAPTHMKSDEALRANSVGALVRSRSPEAQASLANLKKTSLEIGILAARLSPSEAH